ncbi:MAG: GumC family protein, partial [bacterium]
MVGVSFLFIFCAVFVVVLLRPPRYEAQMKILVKRERVDPLVTPEESSQRSLLGVTEEELNSEVELLKSRDLHSQVAVATGLHERSGTGIRALLSRLSWSQAVEAAQKERRIAYAAQRVSKRLKVQPLRKSNVIQVSYASPEPRLSADVLKTLADRYLDEHLAVHRPSGAFDFFEHETERYGGQLAHVQARLSQHSREEGVISVQAEKENAIRQVGELEATALATKAQIAETAQRIRVLQGQLASTPARTTTEIHRGSARLLEQLHSTLVTHELKRIELSRAFQPGYPLLQEVEAQIARVRDAIVAAEKSPLLEETTDRNPTHDYLLTELAKSRSELAGLQARAVTTAAGLAVYRGKAQRLEEI